MAPASKVRDRTRTRGSRARVTAITILLLVLCLTLESSGQTFDSSLYMFVFNQNALRGDVVYSVSCTHTGDIRYNISTFPNGPRFVTIDPLNGNLTLTVDGREVAAGDYELTLHCYDPSSTTGNDFSFLQVSRLEENEFNPVFLHSSTIQVSLNESQSFSPPHEVLNLNASDEDLGAFGSIVYSTQGPLPSPFSLDPSSGIMTLVSSLDYDRSVTQYTIIGTASNPPVPETGLVRSAEILINIKVLDVNDEVPTFSEPDGYHTSVHETAPELGYERPSPGFFNVSCTDLDSPQSDITYSITSEGDAGPFTLNSQTGGLSVTGDLDYENRTSYSFGVSCSDNGVPVNLSSSVLVDVTILAVNEFVPEVVDPGPDIIDIPETIPVGTVLFSSINGTFGTYTYKDEDAGPDGDIYYFLDDHEDSAFFEVDMQNGDLRIIVPLDVDNLFIPIINLRLRLTICDTIPPRPTCPNLLKQVLVFPENEFPPEFPEDDFNLSFSELSAVGTTIAQVTCQDEDRDFVGIAIEWESPSLEVEETFTVNARTGVITTTQSLDYESQTSYTMILRCYDEDFDDFAVVKVTITPENDNLPQFESPSYMFNVSRTTPDNRYRIGQVVAFDKDIDKGGEINYTLVERNNYFAVTNDGTLELYHSLVNNTNSHVNLTVEVTDGTYTNTTLVIIRLTPGNLNQPDISLSSTVFLVSELSRPGTRITALECTDDDTGINGATTLTIIDGNTDQSFAIDSIRQALIVANPLVLPQDSDNVHYDLSVHCEDAGLPIREDNINIFITVFRESAPPEIQNETIVAFVSEDASINDEVTTIVSSELETGELRFSFQSESVPNIFEIDEFTGTVIVAAALDREMVSQYEIVVVVTEIRDEIGPIRSDNATLIIYVRDINDNKPKCETVESVTIEEIHAVGSLVVKMNCSDLDFGSNAEISYGLSNNYSIFAINDHGEIMLVNPLNQTELNTLTFSVRVADAGDPQLHDTYQVTVFISAINRNMPSFVNLPFTLEIGESQSIQQVIYEARATDPDRGSFGVISYGIVTGGADLPFQIFENTGSIILTQKLDHFEHGVYLVNVSASDSDFTVVETLTVIVLDENEHQPQCEATIITGSIPEGLAPPQSLSSKLTCSDNDRGPNGNLTFDIQSELGRSILSISGDGLIVIVEVLDFEDVDRYEVPVEISDSGNPPFSIDATVVVIVQPVNEFPPMFTQEAYTPVIQEGIDVGTSVADVNATDKDNPTHQDGQISYSILGDDQPPFSISSNGVLLVAGNIDREEQSFYTLTVQARDHGQPSLSSTTTVEVTILDLDDSPPEFTQLVYNGMINGTAVKGTPVVTINCTDDDLGINAEVDYSLTGPQGSGFDYFEVSSSGQILVSVDLPVSQTYSFRAVCRSRGPANFSDETIVTIRVLVESNITFVPSSYNTNISEATDPGFTILYINASSSTDVPLTYKLLNTDTPFSVNPTTGELQLFGTLDYETTTTYALRVQASDNGNPPNIGETLVQILVENENDHSPVISTTPTTLTLSEGSMVLPSTVGSYHCTDMDLGNFGQVEFFIASGDTDGVFALSQSGVLQVARELDYETTQLYTLEIVCRDRGIPPRTDRITVPVTVLPINDNPPVFASDSLEVFVTENLPVSSDVGTAIEASDLDLGPHSSLLYRIMSGNSDPRVFAISSTTGQLTLIQSLDYEEKQSFSLIVLVDDSGGQVDPEFTVLNDTIAVEITVVDYNDNTPALSQLVYTGSIEERASINDQVLLNNPVLCTDRDSDTNGEITLHIIEDSPFEIQNSGIVTVSEELDFEKVRNYQLTVQCRDGGNPQLSSEATIIVSVLDFNEFGPVFNQSLYNIQVHETASPGALIGRIFAEDQDAGEAGTVTYSFSNVTTAIFALDSSTGTIILLSSLDYETQTRLFVFEAVANDTAGLEAVTTVIIQVLNDDDNLPRFTRGNYIASVIENTETGVFVVQVSCNDADDQADGIAIGYQLRSSEVPFSLSTGGRLAVAGEIDLELNPRYTFRVACNDSAGNTAETTVTVNIDPFNDFPPVLTGDIPYATDLAENPGIGLSVFQVTATDDDTVKYNEITFRLVSGNEEERFEIDSQSGVVMVTKSIDREEEDVYVLEVEARNVISPNDTTGSPSLSAVTTLTITITDVNDNDPVISPSALSRFIPESQSAGIVIDNFTCSDLDLGLNGLTNFSLSSGAPGVFQLSEDGVLSTTGAITSNVLFDVVCSDNGSPSRTSTAAILIETMSMNDHAPVISGETTVVVPEDTAVGTDVTCYSATDEDGTETPDGVVRYSLEVRSAGASGRFAINEVTGCIFVSLGLSTDFGFFYRYSVIATDGGEPPLSDSQSVVFIIIDVLQDPPMFVGDPYTRVLSEGIESETLIANTVCTDPDENDNITYSIVGGNDGTFTIDQSTGTVTIASNRRLDYEVTTSYSLVVQCTDSEALTDSANVFVTVTPVNEHTPVFQSIQISVLEHSIVGTLVLPLAWTDSDAGADGEVVFNITSGNTDDVFLLTSDGRLLVGGLLDRESLDVYNLGIEIQDQSENVDERRSSTNYINITVSDINDHAPEFERDPYVFGPLQGSEEPGHYLGVLTCDDRDVGANALITYQLSAGNSELFSVNSTSGEFSLSGDLNDRQFDNITFFAECVDAGSRRMTGSTRVLVSVVESNRHSPVFANESYLVVVPEDTRILEVDFLTVVASDNDPGVNGQIRYSLVDDYDTQFYIGSSSGGISLLKPLDFESEMNYQLVVMATDGALDSVMQRSASVNVTVLVGGVNEYAPSCSSGVSVAVIDASTTGALLLLDCSDDDAGKDGELSYTIASGDPQFSISSNGTLTVSTPIAPDPNFEQYNLEISVSDSGTPVLHTEAQVVVFYSFPNLDTPSFLDTIYFLDVSEDEEVGTVIQIFTATDTDPGIQGDIIYSITGTDNFRVDATNGSLFIARPLDYEVLPSEEFTLVAIDSDPSSPRSGSTRVNITLLNVNDNLPRCASIFHPVTISSDAEVGDTVEQLDCSDPDGYALTYRLITNSGLFSVEEMTGRVYVTGTPIPSSTTTLEVAISDVGGMTIDVVVSIQVRLVNEHPPVFTQSVYIFNVSEDSPLLSVVGSIHATDLDSNQAELTFTSDNIPQFYMSPQGEVQLSAPLDYEDVQEYSFGVRVTDSGSFDGSNQLSDTTMVTVNVLNVNDNSPRLSAGGVYGATVQQGTAVGSTVLSFTCRDDDLIPLEAPTISNGPLADTPFHLQSTGEEHSVEVAQAITSPGVYDISIICRDDGGLSAEGEITIFVPEVGAPEFNQSVYLWILSESSPPGTQFTGVDATSSGGGDISYSLADSQGTFYIDRNFGVVTLVSTLDYESQQTHELVVTATDSGNSQSSVLLVVLVEDENDQVPLIDPSTVLEVNQNAPVGYPLGTIQCTDDDTNPNATMHEIAFTPPSSLFSVDSYGVVRLEGLLDSTPVYVIPVTCTSSDDSSVGLVTIQVLFINHHEPQFYFEAYVFSIREDAYQLSVVGTVSAFDDDVGSHGDLIYTIEKQDVPEYFYIERGTGVIRILSPLDREDKDSHNITVAAVDGGQLAPEEGRKKGMSLVTVLIQDANDNAPVPDQLSYTETILSNHTILTTVLSTGCTDPDQGENAQITYSLEPVTEDFAIQSDGTVILTQRQNDEAVYSFYTVCTDNGTPRLSSSSLVTVTVDRAEVSAPVFLMDNYTVTIPESTSVLTEIVQVKAATSDVVYKIVSGSDVFHISPSSGAITLISPLDASEQQLYTLTVEAVSTSGSSQSSFVHVVVMVTDVNDHAPEFSSSLYQYRVAEDATPLTPLVQVTCTDSDPTSNITYEITDGLTTPDLSITQDGLVVVATQLDYESNILYTLEVTCSDGGDTPLTAKTTVRIEVLPVNEFRPEFLQPVYQFEASENSFGTLLGRVEAQDGDAGSQGEITYHLQDPGNFSTIFVEPSTGDILVANNLDYEEQEFWNLTVIARDGASAESYVFLEITVMNLNDVLPIISPVTTITVVSHDAPEGLPIQHYSCTDGDGSQTELTIFQGNNHGYFALNDFNQLIWNGTAGELTSDAIVSLTIQCSDSIAADQRVLAYIAVTIRVTEGIPPVFTQQVYQRVVDENTEVNSSVVTVAAMAENNVQYDLFNLPAGFPFSIDPITGDISVIASLNRELTLLYVFTVRATDDVTGALGLALVEITIGDANDNRPEILPVEQSITLPEDLTWPTQLISFSCTDADTGSNSEVSFQITSEISQSIEDTFHVTSSGIVELVGPLDFETNATYDLNITCFDNGNPPLTDSATLTVVVTGVNEYGPAFDAESYRFSVEEGVTAGSMVGSVSASDRDGGSDGEVRYKIISGSGLGFFSVNSEGEIRTRTQSLNATEFPRLEVILRAEDEGQLSQDVVVTIDIHDINEAPQFSSSSYFAAATSDQPAGTNILEFLCYDTDLNNNSILSAEIAANAHNLDISLEIETTSDGRLVFGTVVTNSPLDAGAFEVVLMCTDSGSPSLNSTASVTIRVEGVNLPPEFSHDSFAISVSEDTLPGTSLTVVNATDFESGTAVLYEISGGNGLGTFSIDPNSGTITLVFSLDHETTPDYAVTVTAYDDFVFNRQSASIQVFIYVINTNDIPPFLSPSGIQVITVSESSEPVFDIKVYTCIDPDGVGVTYSLSGTSPYPFIITQTGVVQLVDTVDYEEDSTYSLTVVCSDLAVRTGEESLLVSSALIIHVTPVNNYPPEFLSKNVFEVSEATPGGTVIATVQATDRDNRGEITYSSSLHADFFLIDQFSGNITLIQELDYEGTQQYELTIEASDNDNTQGLVQPMSATQLVTIQVVDANDNRPQCTSHLLTANLETGTYSYHRLSQLSCSDADNGTNAQLSYTFIDESIATTPNGTFLLNHTTGELGFTGTISTVDPILIEIRVSDMGEIPQAVTVRVTVQVVSGEATQPRFEPNMFNVTLSENSPDGYMVFQGLILQNALRNALAVDEYALLPDPEYGNTFVINPSTGDIFLSSTLLFDFDEGIQEYSLIVQGTVEEDTITAVVRVSLTDYNDNAPKFDEAVYEGSVLENENNLTSILSVTAEDIDSDLNAEFLYSLFGSPDFDINQMTGEIQTLRSFDREIQSTYSFQVYASDLGIPQQIGSALVTITIGDQNDIPPKFVESFYAITINNLSPPGMELLTFVVEDEDITGSFAFRIITEDAEVRDLFTVDSPDGVLRQRSLSIPADHPPQYQFTVEVNDEIQTDTTTVVIYVADATSDTTVFVENIPDQTYNLLNTLLLKNFNISSSATYNITEGDERNEFVVSSNGVLGTRTVLNRESNPEYTLVVQVVDAATSENVAVFITVIVVDQNDNAPVFGRTNYTFFVSEGVYTQRTPIGNVTATDLDEPGSANSRIQYSLIPISGTVPEEFMIDQLTGEITVLGGIDRESHESFRLRVRAQDFGAPDPQVGYTDVLIAVSDMNDNNPQFDPFDVIEFIVNVPNADTPGGTTLDMITAILPGGFEVPLTEFKYTDQDSSSDVVASLDVLEEGRTLKFRLVDIDGDPTNQMLVTMEKITLEDDNGTVLVITLVDEVPESNPISRNITIVIANNTEDDEVTTGTPEMPQTEGVEPTESPGFFDSEIGIAVVVLISLLIVTLLFFFCCLCCYCYLRAKRDKDPRKSRPLTVAQRIQMETAARGTRHFGRPWQYYGYSDIDRLDFPEFSPNDMETEYLYGPGVDYAESAFMGDYPYNNTPSTGTSVLSSVPPAKHVRYAGSEEDIEEEDEEDYSSDLSDHYIHDRDYAMGPILKAMVSEWDKGDELLLEETSHKR